METYTVIPTVDRGNTDLDSTDRLVRSFEITITPPPPEERLIAALAVGALCSTEVGDAVSELSVTENGTTTTVNGQTRARSPQDTGMYVDAFARRVKEMLNAPEGERRTVGLGLINNRS